MDDKKLVELLEAQRDIAKRALFRRGQIATNKPERHELLFKHNMFVTSMGVQKHDERYIRICTTNASYPPSKVPLSQLEPILLADLRLETQHNNKVIFLRAIATAIRSVSVTNVVEDTSGAGDRISVYNVNPMSDPQDTIRKGQIYAVKEPYYKTSMDGGYSIRVDHPSDFVLLPDGHDLIPREFRPRAVKTMSAKAYKDEGNVHYKAKAYQSAIDSYGRGIQACTDRDRDVQADLHRNRAQANLQLGRYEHALWDANKSLEQLSRQTNARILNCKAFYRAGRALYSLHRFSEARAMFKQALQCSPSDDDALKALDAVKKRIVEATTGIYDMDLIIAHDQTPSKPLDIASYVKNVAVRSADGRGRGLFAQKDFKTGDTIMFEKAFEISLPLGPATANHFIVDVNTSSGFAGTHATLFYTLIEKLRYNSSLARQFLDLHNKGYKPNYHACKVDEYTVIDSFEVLTILKSNCFGIGHPGAKEPDNGVGIWLTASYVNHACDVNASRIFLGDMMLVRASQDIAKGEEIFMSYVDLQNNYEDIQKELQDAWGFKCACDFCTAESKITAAQRVQRRARLRELTALIEANSHPDQRTISPRITQQAEAIYAKAVETYSPTLYAGIPRLELVLPSFWIATSYATRIDLVRTRPACLEVLRNCGVFVTINKNKVTFDRQHSVVSHIHPVIDCAVNLMVQYEGEGQHTISSQFEAFARSMWLVINPTLKGFEERYSFQ